MASTWFSLVEYRRFGLTEVTLHGAISWVVGQRVIYERGGENLVYGRSVVKPLQMKVFARDLDGVLSPEAKAISVASHNAEDDHLLAAKSILEPAKAQFMKVPASMPLVSAPGVSRHPDLWNHPCSGKHAAIIKGCEIRGWPVGGYTDPTHPYHAAFMTELRRALGPSWTPQFTAKDGCGLPTVSSTVTELAKLYSHLAVTKDEDWIWSAMTDRPHLVGGSKRLDTAIMQGCGGNVLAKEGADGLLCLSILHKDFSEGLGIAIKLASGWNAQAMWYIARALLGSLGFDQIDRPAPLDRQTAWVSAEVVPPNYHNQFHPTDLAANVDDHWS